MLSNYKHEIIVALFILVAAFVTVYLYGLVLPFVFGLVLAFASRPVVKGIQKRLKNLAASVVVYLVAWISVIVLVVVFLAQYVNRDFQRLNASFVTLVDQNQEELDAAASKVKEYVSSLYDFEEISAQLEHKADSLATTLEDDGAGLNTESIESAYDSIMSVFDSSEKEEKKITRPHWGFWSIFFSTIVYFILILFELDYFTGLRDRYAGGRAKSRIRLMWQDFDQTFLKYFRLRSKIVLLLLTLYAIAFLALDLPGTFLILILIFILSYIPFLQYLALIPLAISCLVLSIETPMSFMLIYGIVIGVFILATIIEEVWLTPRIMEKNIGLNPVIMVLAASIGGYLFGTPGVIIGIPLASLCIIYIKRFIVPSMQKVDPHEQS